MGWFWCRCHEAVVDERAGEVAAWAGVRRHIAAAAGLCLAAATGCSSTPPSPSASLTVLTCAASAGQQAADPSVPQVNGVESAALTGDTNAYDSLPAWNSSDGRRYLIWKVYLAIAPAALPYRVITVTSPASARLFYASPFQWGRESGQPVVPPPPRSVELSACGRRYAGYTGGILVSRPTCVTLEVTGPKITGRTITVPVLVEHC